MAIVTSLVTRPVLLVARGLVPSVAGAEDTHEAPNVHLDMTVDAVAPMGGGEGRLLRVAVLEKRGCNRVLSRPAFVKVGGLHDRHEVTPIDLRSEGGSCDVRRRFERSEGRMKIPEITRQHRYYCCCQV